MTSRQLSTPFGDDAYDATQLASLGHLSRVLVQLRFDSLAALDLPSSNAASKFAELMGSKYPYLDKGTETTLVIDGGRGQVSQQQVEKDIYRFSSPDKKTVVSLSNGSLALETTEYSGRNEFCDRVRVVAEALRNVAFVPEYSRIGYRYTSRVTDDGIIDNLPRFVRQEILGISAVKLNAGVNIQHSLAQASFQVKSPQRGLLVQWGLMPAHGTFDPTLPALPTRSWVLDIDSYVQGEHISPDPDQVGREASELSKMAERFFRWAVTDEYLSRSEGAQ
ncbi:TIGR04255 family protein [Streptomyces clavifer]|uniref:TIGR04255 family protein n=1 Tax=Streptomyces clavifer TaxID=68188 RepID=UPI0034416342